MSGNKTRNRKTCEKCKRTIMETNFYQCKLSPLYPDGRFHICTKCLAEMFEGDNAYDMALMVLHAMNRPFLFTLWETSANAGDYIRQINSLQQYQGMTWEDSSFSQMYQASGIKHVINPSDSDGEISAEDMDEMVVKWGEGYSFLEIKQLEKFYEDMMRANDIQTPQHISQLKLLCKMNLEQNKALSDKRFVDFKNLNHQYNQVLRDSGFRPIDRRSGGESSGIRTFSQVWEEIEKDGFIKPTPVEENQDIIDRTIMYMGNYMRKLLNINSMTEPPTDTPKVDGDKE